MRRHLFNLAAAVSLVLCAATVAMWVRSYRVGDVVCRFRSGTYRMTTSCRGQLCLQTGPTSYPDGSSWTTQLPFYLFTEGIPSTDWRFLGFERTSGAILNGRPGRRFSVLFVPYWPFALLFALTPAFRVRRRRKPAAGHCVRCGYDLRATPERCPECGTAAKVEG